jgi:hypothetical protein
MKEHEQQPIADSGAKPSCQEYINLASFILTFLIYIHGKLWSYVHS